MGQTLTHGVYLPDEGERNCYNGLAANWQILDNSVGTIAAHTAALAGKAPLVHTHTKSDITDFPVYGNVAGTICEGNDSRLSDARTPVAHTHTKSDVTDLFNSANAWSTEQTVLNNFYVVKENNYELGQSYPNGNHLSGLHIKDKNDSTVGLLDIVDRSYGNMEMRIRVQQKFDPNSNNRSTSGDILYNEMIVGITPTKNNYLGFNADLWGGNTYNLGTASSKWKTLNGINPGALSLPKNANSASYNIDTTNWTTDGSIITYTPLLDGWLYINARNDDTNGDSFIVFDDAVSSFGTSVFGNKGLQNNGAGLLCLMMPVNKNNGINIRIKSPGIISARLYPCNGNV